MPRGGGRPGVRKEAEKVHTSGRRKSPVNARETTEVETLQATSLRIANQLCLIFIEPPALEEEIDERHENQRDEEDQQHHGRGLPEAHSVEGGLVDQVRREEGGVIGAAARHHVGGRKGVLEGQNHVAHGEQNQPRTEQRQRDGREHLPAIRPVHAGGILDLARDVAQPRQQEDESLADSEERHEDDGGKRPGGVRKPGRRKQAEGPQRGVERTVERVQDPSPRQRVGRVGDDRRQVRGRAIESNAAARTVVEQCQPERAEDAERDSLRDEEQRVDQRDPEEWVCAQELEISPANEDGRIDAVVLGQRDEKGKTRGERDEEKRSQEVGREEEANGTAAGMEQKMLSVFYREWLATIIHG